jgi:hypothetical protein
LPRSQWQRTKSFMASTPRLSVFTLVLQDRRRLEEDLQRRDVLLERVVPRLQPKSQHFITFGTYE